MIIHNADDKDNVYTLDFVNGYALCMVYKDDTDDNVAWLANVRVHPDYRQQGLGNLLINQSIQFAREHGFEYLKLATLPGWRVDWYKRHGFEIIMDNYCGRVIMQYNL